VRDPAVKKLGPEGQKVIDQVEQPLTEAVMQELNSRVTLDKKKESEVATEYLKESGFIK
jgi:glycine betaine/choline ABC-type transport system substrate-binding protein